MSKKIAVGISGGVDSCAAAYMLQKQGFEVLGITLRLKPDCSDDDGSAEVAAALGIEHLVLDLREEFDKKIIAPFIAEYIAARTPNPCVICNREIKFGVMLDAALAHGCERLATGHYAKTEFDGSRHLLLRTESAKDQSYFLCMLRQEQLARAVFPLAGADKDAVRSMSLSAGLPPARKHDSQEICFVPGDDYHSFLASRGVSSPAGNIIDRSGKVIGRHTGITDYTIGQRKGLGAFGQPMFVTDICAESNTVTIAPEGGQYSQGFVADSLNYIGVEGFDGEARAQVKIRFRAKPVPATVYMQADGTVKVIFDEPARSVTPGQFAVIYDGRGSVLAGSRIIRRLD